MASPRSIISVVVSLLLVAILFPIVMTEVTGANTTGWDTSVTTIFATVLPILAVIGIAMKYIPTSKG